MTVQWGRVSFAALTLGVSVGCSSAETGTIAETGGSSGNRTGIVVTRSKDQGGNDGALVAGELVKDGNCLYLGTRQSRYPVVWPRGAKWSAADEAVVLSDGSIVKPGDSIEGGGGYREIEGIGEQLNSDGRDQLAGCIDPQSSEIAAFNDGQQLRVAN